MSTTRIRQHVRAPRAKVYAAIVDAKSVATWMVPDGMTSLVHAFDARPGGTFRVSLTYDAPTGAGKSSARTDTYHGRFVELVPGERVVQTMEFETDEPRMQGEMKTTFELVDADGGTEVIGTHENVPPGVKPSDNELGWKMALSKLAALVEGIAWPVLAVLALLVGCQPQPPSSVYDCSQYDEHKHLASGRMEATIGGQRLASWHSSVQSIADRDLYMSACVVEDGKETWRFSAKLTFDGPVTSTPVTVAVPSQNAPGLFGGFLDVTHNREHHFLLDGAGTVTVTRYDPAARAFDASGVVYPKQGGEIPLAFALTWAARELGPRPK